MNERLIELLENYKDGVPVKIDRSSILFLSAAAILVVAVSTGIIKIVKKL